MDTNDWCTILTNGISHSYYLGEFIFILRDIRSNFSFLFHFAMKIMQANRIAPDGTPRLAASHLGLFCLPMSHKKDTSGLYGLRSKTRTLKPTAYTKLVRPQVDCASTVWSTYHKTLSCTTAQGSSLVNT